MNKRVLGVTERATELCIGRDQVWPKAVLGLRRQCRRVFRRSFCSVASWTEGARLNNSSKDDVFQRTETE